MAYRLFQRIARVSRWYSARYTPLGQLLGGLTLAAAIFATDPSRTHANVLLAVLFAVFALAFLCNLRWHPALVAQRLLPPYAVVGARVTYHVRVRNQGSIPERALVVREHLRERYPQPQDMQTPSATLGDADNWFDRRVGFRRWLRQMHRIRGAEIAPQSLPLITAQGEAEIAVSFLPLRRGLIEFAALNIARADPLGISRVIQRVALPQQLLVLPRHYPMQNLLDPRSGAAVPTFRATYGNSHGSSEFQSVREYRVGDPLRHIHWRASAKRGVHVVKQFVEGFPQTLRLLIDPVADAENFEALIEVLASLVVAATRHAAQGVALEWLDLPGTSQRATPLGAQGVQWLLAELALRERAKSDRFEAATARLRIDPKQTTLFITGHWQPSRRQFSKRLNTALEGAKTLIVSATSTPASDLSSACTVLRTDHLALDLHRFGLSSGQP
jgi:uncharacterized protein (DUF58 family)